MKTTFFLLMFVLSGLSVKAQHLAMTGNKTQPDSPIEVNKTAPNKAPQFIFQNYGIDLSHHHLKDYPQHVLDNQVAKKMYAVEKIYVRHHPASVGFTDNTLEIYKPTIYNAITKLEAYYKKAVRKNQISTAEAASKLAEFLDIVYIVYYAEGTENLEKALRKAKTPQQIVDIFNSVLIKE